LPGRAVVVAANVQRPLAEFGRVQNFAQTGLISLKRNVTACLSEKRRGPVADCTCEHNGLLGQSIAGFAGICRLMKPGRSDALARVSTLGVI